MGTFERFLTEKQAELVDACAKVAPPDDQFCETQLISVLDAWRHSFAYGKKFQLIAPLLDAQLSPKHLALYAVRLQSALWAMALATRETPSVYESMTLATLTEDAVQQAQEDHPRGGHLLAPAEQHLRRVLELTDVGWFDWNMRTDLVEMSEQMCAQWQTPGNAPIAVALQRIHPDDRAKTGSLIQQAIAHRMEFVTQYRLLLDDGTIRWIDARGRVFYDQHDTPLNFVGTSVDVTHQRNHDEIQRNARQWLETILAHLPIPLIMVEPKTGEHTFANHAANSMLGQPFDLHDDSNTYGDLFDVRDAAGYRLLQHEMPSFRSANGELLRNYEVSWHTNGTRYDLLFSSTSIPAIFGRKESIVCLFQDVTSLKVHQRFLQERLDEWRLEKQLREKQLATLMHDVRTPLSAASLAAQMAERSVEINADKTKHSLRRIDSNLRRIDDMLRRLLDAQSAQAGSSLSIHRQPAKLGQVLEEGVRELNSLHGNRIRFSNSVGEAKLNCDEQALRRVLDNLVNNAVKYGHPTTPISVQFAGGRSRVSLQVHNEGPAISAADQASLFTAYYRAEGAEKSDTPGWGLGLSVVYDIARAHGGNVCLSSSAQSGTTFDVSFPVAEIAHESATSSI